MTDENLEYDPSSINASTLPSLDLLATNGSTVNLSQVDSEYLVIYAYPRTSAPGVIPLKDWDIIPGAKGCTPQSCSFRDHHDELQALGASVFGISTQSTEYQYEAAQRLHLPFLLLSDSKLEFANALGLPTFKVEDQILLGRLTLICQRGRIRHVMYPVQKPEENASNVLSLLSEWQK